MSEQIVKVGKKVRLSPRDYAALSWIAQMRAISESDLGMLLGRLAGRYDADGRVVAIGAAGVRDVLLRWRRAGLAEARRVMFGTPRPRVVVLTSQGAALVATGHRYSAPAMTSLQHTLEVGRVRLHLEQKHRERLTEWVTESDWRAEHHAEAAKGRSAPDAEVVIEGKRYAVEVELTAKSADRLTTKLRDLAGRGATYEAVLYYCGTESVRRQVSAAVDEVKSYRAGLRQGSTTRNGMPDRDPHFTVVLLPGLQSGVAA